MQIEPIGYIHTDFKEKFGIPRQSGRVESLVGRIELLPEYKGKEALRGIEEFSHLWLIFGFSKAERSRDTLTVRPPRLGGNRRIGVFASRSPFRPNSLGLSVVKLERVEGEDLIVSGVDLLDGTPIYDIKPYLPYADAKPDAKGSYAEENRDYCLEVDFPDALLEKLPEDKRRTAIDCLREDPRPSYHDDERVYSMLFADCDVRFFVKGNRLTVVAVDR